jgi:hypothetical protein
VKDLPFWLRNLPHRARGLKQEFYRLARIGYQAQLSAVLYDRNGMVVKNFGVIGRRMVTTAGVTALAATFTNTVEPETFNYHDAGTGTTAESAAHTALVTPWGGARVAGTQTNPGSTNVYRSVATITFTGNFAITEHGLFGASSGGTMLDRTLFAAINVENGSSIAFTWELTLPSGG